ncbi:MAG: TIGR03009 domain-containing protein [Gemmataceae bacterium]
MRLCCVAVFTLLLIHCPLSAQQRTTAQQAPQRSVANPQDIRMLNAVLARWEQAMKNVATLQTTIRRTSIDKVFNTKEIYKGYARYLKTKHANLATLHLQNMKRKAIFEKYVITSDYLYQYDPTQKLIRVQRLPKGRNGQLTDDNFLGFLFGMDAAEAKKRYDLRYIAPPENDKWYYYIEIRAKRKEDKADFTRARLVLLRSTFMPRQLWFEEQNGNEVFWDFESIDTKANLRVTDFAQPKLPAGWQFRREPIPPQPRMSRGK